MDSFWKINPKKYLIKLKNALKYFPSNILKDKICFK